MNQKNSLYVVENVAFGGNNARLFSFDSEWKSKKLNLSL